MTGLVLAVVAGLGVYYVFTAVAFRWDGLGFGPPPSEDRRALGDRIDDWLVQAGLEEVRIGEFAAVVAMLFVLGAAMAFAAFGGAVPALIVGLFFASFPVASYRLRRKGRRNRSHEAWPRMIEEIRVLTGSVGRSIPQALFEVGERAPEEMRPAFAAAHREWLISTDFARTLDVLKGRLVDPTADVVCETLLVAHQVGGSDLQGRLEALAEDRVLEMQGRKDADAKQAGARFARYFVLVVPVGMALAGMSIGSGRESYSSSSAQLFVAVALLMVIGCWAWAGSIMSLPEEERVFG